MIHSSHVCCGLCRFMASLNLETVVEAKGYIVSANVKSCTQKTVELKVESDNQYEWLYYTWLVPQVPKTL